MTPIRQGLLMLAVIPILAGCPMKNAVWIQEGSTSRHLVFGVGGEHGDGRGTFVPTFTVDRCEDNTLMWGAGQGPGAEVMHATITYGLVPPGYERLRGRADSALTLLPGCYEARAGGSGRAVFDVLEDGAVVERPAEQ